MPGLARSINGVMIRLTYERWYHIVESHDDMASYFDEALDTIESPEIVVRGNSGTLKAARNLGRERWMTVIYRELSMRDGFVITAYILGTKPKGEIIWQR